MPLIFQHRVYRKDLKANPDVLYLFGDNLQRVGLGGQAREMRGEENAVGVATKRAPGMREGDFFSDADYDEVTPIIYRDIYRARWHHLGGGAVVIPLDGLGTGLSELPQRAPRIYAYLTQELDW